MVPSGWRLAEGRFWSRGVSSEDFLHSLPKGILNTLLSSGGLQHPPKNTEFVQLRREPVRECNLMKSTKSECRTTEGTSRNYTRCQTASWRTGHQTMVVVAHISWVRGGGKEFFTMLTTRVCYPGGNRRVEADKQGASKGRGDEKVEVTRRRECSASFRLLIRAYRNLHTCILRYIRLLV